jgi:REP element-mobilizing transposase RayT
MGQSLAQLYVHLTFGTKNRFPFITDELGHQIHPYMAGIFKNYESPALIINSVSEHIHILFRLSKNYALAKVVEIVKKESSKWVKTIDFAPKKFAWQDGYGAFSVSSSKVETVRRYIENQKTHHRKKTYKEEVEEFIKEYDIIDYNKEYFWR